MLDHRLQKISWTGVEEALNTSGYASLATILEPSECSGLVRVFDDDEAFRSHIHMERRNFGRGEYKYFSYPLPELVAGLRRDLYPFLAPIANRWADQLNLTDRYPETHEAFLATCHAAGQTRPTPLILSYREGDYNRLHQDLYGDILFPLQVVILLNEPGADYRGGEFVLTQQRPRMQARAEVVPMRLGEAVVFAVNDRPVMGARGFYRMKMRHGVSTVRSGARHALGVIFHDAL